MRARVSDATLRRVEELLKRAHMPGRYLAVPERLSIDEWEQMAMPSQARLALSHHEDVAPLPYVENHEYRKPPRGGVLVFHIIRTPTGGHHAN